MVLPSNLFVSESTSAKKTMKLIDTNGFGAVFVVGPKKKLSGVATPGDIRRSLDNGFDIHSPISECMNTEPLVLPEGLDHRASLALILSELSTKERKLNEKILTAKIPIINKSGQVTNVAHYNQEDGEFSLIFGKMVGAKDETVRRILIVGGAGYLGSVLTRRLLEAGYEVRILDSLIFGKKSVTELLHNKHFELIEGDVRNIQTMHRSLDGVDAVIHLAAIVGDPASKKNPRDTIGVNYLASMTLAMACKYYQINRFIFASTCSVYGVGAKELDESAELHPVSLYARTKIESENGILSLSDTNFQPIIMRMGTLYGLSPRMRFDLVVNTFAKMATTKKRIEIFGGDQWRPFVHVEDAAEAYIKIIETPLSELNAQVFNVGTNDQNYMIKELGSFVTAVLPKTKVIIKKASINSLTDKRTYKVSFQRIMETLHFSARHTIKEALVEINSAIESGQIENVDDSNYYN